MDTKIRKLDMIPLAALICYGASVLPFMPQPVSNVAGAVLCFVLTGVAAAIALMPPRASAIAWFIAVIACSLAAGIVGGLLLHYLPSGIVQFNWVTYAFVTTLIAYGVARARGLDSPMLLRRPEFRLPSWSTGAKILVSVGIVAAAVVIATNSTPTKEMTFTELWLVPEGSTHSPVDATSAVLGVKSHEASTENFTVVMDTGEQVMTNRITLAPNEVWTLAVPLGGERAVASVYKGDVTDRPYRTVWIAPE